MFNLTEMTGNDLRMHNFCTFQGVYLPLDLHTNETIICGSQRQTCRWPTINHKRIQRYLEGWEACAEFVFLWQKLVNLLPKIKQRLYEIKIWNSMYSNFPKNALKNWDNYVLSVRWQTFLVLWHKRYNTCVKVISWFTNWGTRYGGKDFTLQIVPINQ